MHRRSFLTGVAATTVGSTAIVSGQKGGGKTHTVKMANKAGEYVFDPIGLYVEPGDTVKWVIDSGKHSTTSYSKGNPSANNTLIPKGAKSWDSGTIGSGKSFSYTFEKKGTYDYYCIPHKTLGMVGRIVCGEPGGPAEKSEIPDKPGSGVIPPSDEIVKEKSLSYPYIPNTGHGGPPALFWGGFSIFSLTSVYLFSVYDRKTGRYDQASNAETILNDEHDRPAND
nr:plastocyanin/azurin family copper-binding protein [Haladaptatus sp. AB618]